MTKSFSFKKSERLTSKKEIDSLFLLGEAFFIYPFKVHSLLAKQSTPTRFPLKVVMSVPKRNFKRANKRNHLRRLMKETYRLNKQQLINALLERQLNLQVMFVYMPKEELTYQDILPKMVKSLDALKVKVETSIS